MSISFSLYKNNLTEEPNLYRAVVQPGGSIGYDSVIDQVLIHHSTVTRSDVLAVLDSFFLIVENLLLLGYNVNTPGVNFRTKIKGNFEGQNDGFVPGRNSVEVSATPGPRLRKGIQHAQVQKQEGGDRSQPRPLDYTDLNTGELNRVLTPGGMGQLTGYRLKFDLADLEQGIFFVPLGEANTARVSVVGKNGPSELMFLVPPTLIPDNYRLEIRSAMGNGMVRTGVLADTLIVS
jgi:hypothetical protein